jgi:hypothetical protein
MSFNLQEFQVDALIARRDLLAAMETATHSGNPILQEKVRFRYGESIELLDFLVDMLQKRTHDPKLTIDTRFNILRIGLKAIEDNRIEVIDYLQDLVDNYLALLEWANQIEDFERVNLMVLNSIFSFVAYLPAIQEIAPATTTYLRAQISTRQAQGTLNLLLSRYQERILQEDPKDIDFHDYSRLAEIAGTLVEKAPLLAEYEQYNRKYALKVLCQYLTLCLEHQLMGQLLSDGQLRFLTIALQFQHLHARSSEVQAEEEYRLVAKQVFDYLTHFFNKKLLDILQNRDASFSDLEIANSCRRISQTYYGLAEGQLGFYFQLLSQKHWQNIEPAIDEYFQKKAIAHSFSLPDYMFGVNYQFDILLFELLLERLTYLDALDDRLKEHEIMRIRDQGRFRNDELFDFLYYLFRQSSSDEHALLWQDLNFAPFSVQVQTRILFHILQYNKQETETVQSWFSPLIFTQLDNYGNAFSADVIQAYRSFFRGLHDGEQPWEYPTITQFIFDHHWAFLQTIVPALPDQGAIRAEVQQLGRATIAFATAAPPHNYECFHRFIQFWSGDLGHHYFQGRGNKGFNKRNFAKLCQLIKDCVHRKYAGVELFYWQLTERNIIDEINILLDKNNSLS